MHVEPTTDKAQLPCSSYVHARLTSFCDRQRMSQHLYVSLVLEQVLTVARETMGSPTPPVSKTIAPKPPDQKVVYCQAGTAEGVRRLARVLGVAVARLVDTTLTHALRDTDTQPAFNVYSLEPMLSASLIQKRNEQPRSLPA